MGANHNFFNKDVWWNDRHAQDWENANPPISREEQENFLSNFAVVFLTHHFIMMYIFILLVSHSPIKCMGRI